MVSTIGSYAGAQSGMLQALRERYSQTDTDGDGSLTLEEFTAGAPQGAPDNIEDIFSQLDTNGDGGLSEDEFLAGPKGHRPPQSSPLSGDMQQQLAEMFQSVDEDGDGFLSLEEFKAGAPKDAPGNQEDFFSSLDTNGDGLLTQDEFTSGLAAKGPSGPPPGPPPGGGGASGSDDDEDDDLLSKLIAELQNSATSGTDGSAATTLLDGSAEDAQSFLDLYDQNGDGQLSKDEATAGFDALRREMMSYLLNLQSTSTTGASA